MNRAERLRRAWDKDASRYDSAMSRAESRYFAPLRPWLCSRAHGTVVEIAVGTGLNLPHYPTDAQIVGFEWSPAMVDVAGRRAGSAGRQVDLRVGDAQAIDFPDSGADAVVCTFGLCAIPDHVAALAEMDRILRPGGLLLLADHVISTNMWWRWGQRIADAVSVPARGEHFRRRPYTWVVDHGYEVRDYRRTDQGIIEAVVAGKPGPSASPGP